MNLNWRTLGSVFSVTLMLACSAAAKSEYGTLSGVILDPAGTPQMGAAVSLISEDSGGRTVSHLLSNQLGAFVSDRLRPGKYAIRVSLAGFLPTTERHIGVTANLTTLLRVQIDSLFSSINALRPTVKDLSAEPDDWKWVLRSSVATRTILQWRDSDVSLASNTNSAEFPRLARSRGLVQFSSGAVRPGSPSNLSDSPATAMAYDQSLGGLSRLLVAGQMSYEGGASGGFATVWLPSGSFDQGPQTIFVARQSKLGAGNLAFQGLRLDHSEQIAFGDHVTLRAGAEYLRAGIVSSTSSLHPHARLDVTLSPSWMASLVVTASPADPQMDRTTMLESAMIALDSLPAVFFRNGRPVIEEDWHQEASVKHKLTSHASVEAAAFHDRSRHEAIFGTGAAGQPDFLQDPFSNAFIYDGGGMNTWGTRVAYVQKISDNVSITAVFSRAGALSPNSLLNTRPGDLRESLGTRDHNSLAGRVSGKVPKTGTQVTASYKWISGGALSRLDPFGEASYEMEPNLHLSIRQPLPGFGLGSRWQALADFSNLLAQGYVPVGQDTRIALAPVLRSFRGGVSFQF